ncbi:MAG: hypothetical protein MSH24_04030 [Lachnospiraceae bacterium]|nr:hypothetical protein [Lachnospiraceae bacterium]
MNNIYIVCIPNKASGGPEAMNQLCRALRDTGYSAQMFFPPYDTKKYSSPIAEEYQHYENPYTINADDAPDNYFIFPEIMIINKMPMLKYSKKIMWWLSVDNFIEQNRVFGKELLSEFINLYYDYHFVQSEYARRFCIDEMGIPEDKIVYISDYLNDSYISKAKDNTIKNKKNQVLYNPKKGIEFTRLLMNYAPDITWIPLIDMTYDEVRDTMQESKVYIDFGNHPGMDRLPREAAINGCCVITDRRGAAAFSEDVPIPDKYKFDDNEDSVSAIVDAIRSIFQNYDSDKKDFDDYRMWISGAKDRFYSDTEKVFGTIIKC